MWVLLTLDLLNVLWLPLHFWTNFYYCLELIIASFINKLGFLCFYSPSNLWENCNLFSNSLAYQIFPPVCLLSLRENLLVALCHPAVVWTACSPGLHFSITTSFCNHPGNSPSFTQTSMESTVPKLLCLCLSCLISPPWSNHPPPDLPPNFFWVKYNLLIKGAWKINF